MASLRRLAKVLFWQGRCKQTLSATVRYHNYDSRTGVPRKWLAFLQKDFDFSQEGLLRKAKEMKAENEKYMQRYIPERHKILGPDLATAHFIVKRGGAVKFVGRDRWIRMDKQGNYHIPNRLVPGMYLEAVDASGTPLMYEGLDNFVDLNYLRYLSFINCPNFDDWCLTRLHIFRDTLEFLDVSGCPQISHRGLAWLHNLYNLQGLRIANMPSVGNLELITLMLEEAIPNCKVIGVDHQRILEEPISPRLEESSSLEEAGTQMAAGSDSDGVWREDVSLEGRDRNS